LNDCSAWVRTSPESAANECSGSKTEQPVAINATIN
jgi:hypothetical protein